MTTAALQIEKIGSSTVSSSSSSPKRRANKPLMEKRRRARINQSLADLRSLILDYFKKEKHRTAKLEKADILETTLQYLQELKRSQRPTTITAFNGDHLDQFQEGYVQCIREVRHYLSAGTGRQDMDPEISQKIIEHISDASSRTKVPRAEAQPAMDPPSIDGAQSRQTIKLTKLCTVRLANTGNNHEMILLFDNPQPPTNSLNLELSSLAPTQPHPGRDVFNCPLPQFHQPINHAHDPTNIMWRPW